MSERLLTVFHPLTELPEPRAFMLDYIIQAHRGPGQVGRPIEALLQILSLQYQTVMILPAVRSEISVRLIPIIRADRAYIILQPINSSNTKIIRSQAGKTLN